MSHPSHPSLNCSCKILNLCLKGYLGRENSRYFLPAVASAQRAVREVAAYLLDKVHAKVRWTKVEGEPKTSPGKTKANPVVHHAAVYCEKQCFGLALQNSTVSVLVDVP